MLCLESHVRLSQGNKKEGLDESLFSPCETVGRVGKDKAQKRSTVVGEGEKDKHPHRPPSSASL